MKKAREGLVGKFLKSSKSYDKLNSEDMTSISESISVRLHLFKGNYPAFMSHAVRAVMEHPNLTQSEREKLNTFTKMFELDW